MYCIPHLKSVYSHFKAAFFWLTEIECYRIKIKNKMIQKYAGHSINLRDFHQSSGKVYGKVNGLS